MCAKKLRRSKSSLQKHLACKNVQQWHCCCCQNISATVTTDWGELLTEKAACCENSTEKAFGATIFGFKERLCDGLKSLLWSFKWKSFLDMCLSLGFKEVLWLARWGDNCVSWSFVVCFSRQVGIIVICWLLEQEHSNCTFSFPLCGWHMNDIGCLCCHDNHSLWWRAVVFALSALIGGDRGVIWWEKVV